MRITSKGQVTIPLHVREKLGLLPNTEVEFHLDGDGVRLIKSTRRSSNSLGRRLVEHMRGRATRTMTTDEIMRLTRGE